MTAYRAAGACSRRMPVRSVVIAVREKGARERTRRAVLEFGITHRE
jgi:hypothetical protein